MRRERGDDWGVHGECDLEVVNYGSQTSDRQHSALGFDKKQPFFRNFAESKRCEIVLTHSAGGLCFAALFFGR